MQLEEYCPDHSAHKRAIEQHDLRLNAHGQQLDKISETLAALQEIERQNQERIDAVDERLRVLEAVPAKRWDAATACVLTTVIGAVVGFVISSLSTIG